MDEAERELVMDQIDRAAVRIAMLAKEGLPKGSAAIVILRGPRGEMTLASTGTRAEGLEMLQAVLADITDGQANEWDMKGG